MKFTATLLAALATVMAGQVHANPVPAETTGSEIEARQAEAFVYLCPGPNWTGPCEKIGIESGSCINIEAIWQTLGSVGPDPGVTCSMWVEPGNCNVQSGNLNSGGFGYPGIANLQDWSGWSPSNYWFTSAKSLQCVF